MNYSDDATPRLRPIDVVASDETLSQAVTSCRTRLGHVINGRVASKPLRAQIQVNGRVVKAGICGLTIIDNHRVELYLTVRHRLRAIDVVMACGVIGRGGITWLMARQAYRLPVYHRSLLPAAFEQLRRALATQLAAAAIRP